MVDLVLFAKDVSSASELDAFVVEINPFAEFAGAGLFKYDSVSMMFVLFLTSAGGRTRWIRQSYTVMRPLSSDLSLRQ